MSRYDINRLLNYSAVMPRWEPDSRERLQAAALELFGDQGFEHTTVADIADRVGVSNRTFFRHFVDKRDVLFAGADEFQRGLAEAAVAASCELTPLEAIAAALTGFDWDAMAPRWAQRQRQRVIAASPELMERELIKFEALAAAFAAALRRRGTTERAADLAAHTGITVFRTAYGRWTDADGADDMGQIVNDVLLELRVAVAVHAHVA